MSKKEIPNLKKKVWWAIGLLVSIVLIVVGIVGISMDFGPVGFIFVAFSFIFGPAMFVMMLICVQWVFKAEIRAYKEQEKNEEMLEFDEDNNNIEHNIVFEDNNLNNQECVDEKDETEIICEKCLTKNPAEYKHCINCGCSLNNNK